MERVENIGGHYAKTLRLWKEKFLESFETKIRTALKLEHPRMTEEEIDVFRRKWEVRIPDLFSACMAWLTLCVRCSTISLIARQDLSPRRWEM